MAIKDGWKTRNEVRREENLEPLERLEEPLVPMNMVPADQAGKEPQEPQEPPVDQKAVRIAHRPMLLEQSGCAVRRVVGAVRTAYRKTESFHAAADNIGGDDADYLSRVLVAPSVAYHVAIGGEAAYAVQFIRALADQTTQELRGQIASAESDVTLTNIETELPGTLAERILTELGDTHHADA